MAATPADSRRSTILAAALFASALAILGVRTIKAGQDVGAKPLPTADLQAMSAFLRPLPDSSLLAQRAATAMVVTRDPFAQAGVAQSGSSSRTTTKARRPATVDEKRWVVSTILFEGTRRSAIVNNAWVTVGDSLGGGSRLTAVERDHIVVTDAKGVKHIVPIQGGESW